MSANLGWLFYKDYFEGIEDYLNIDEKSISKKVDELIATQVAIESRIEEDTLGNSHFKATTTYPGLLLGIGNGHELPSVKGQAILGFNFDYTTGLPEITGSSIKGVLRSAFNAKDGYGYIKELLGKIDEEISLDKKELQRLEEEIFGQTNGSNSTIQGKDVFFDAYIINKVGNILGDDYITPHGDNPLIEPVPLRFIKVLPEVTFMFDFEFSDGLLSVADKNWLFRLILDDLGLGAKTNVGYGYFDNYTRVQSDAEKKEEERRKEEKLYSNAIASDDIEKANTFKHLYPDHIHIDKIEIKIQELENLAERSALQKAWDNIDKKNKKYIESFITKHQDNLLVKDIITEASRCLDQNSKLTEELGFETLLNIGTLKKMTVALQKYNHRLSDDEVYKLVTHIEGDNCKNDLKKKKDFKFPLFKKVLGDEMGQRLGDDLFGN